MSALCNNCGERPRAEGLRLLCRQCYTREPGVEVFTNEEKRTLTRRMREIGIMRRRWNGGMAPTPKE